jgi:hypothetical protein
MRKKVEKKTKKSNEWKAYWKKFSFVLNCQLPTLNLEEGRVGGGINS